MSEKSEKNDKNKFKTTKNDGFGASKLENLKPGDLVSWNSWCQTLDNTVFEEKNGLLLEIFKEERAQGWGYMCRIMPFGDEKEVILPLISLKKMQKRN